MILKTFLPLPLEVLRPLGAPTIGPPPRPVSLSTAALFTDMEKFLCKYKQVEGSKGDKQSAVGSVFCTCCVFGRLISKKPCIFEQMTMKRHLAWGQRDILIWDQKRFLTYQWSDTMTSSPTCSSSVKDTSARGGKGSSCNMGRNSLSCRSIGI